MCRFRSRFPRAFTCELHQRRFLSIRKSGCGELMRTSNVQHRTSNIERGTRRRGYVLIVTLALLVLSATVMVGVGRMALRETILARHAQDDLQQRWGVISIRIAIMPFAEQILQTAEAIQKRPMPSVSSHIMLANQ